MNPYDTLLYSPSGELIHSRNNCSTIQNNFLAITYAAYSDSLPNFRNLYPIHHTILSTIIQSSYLRPPSGDTMQSIDKLQSTLSFRKIQSVYQLYCLHQTCPYNHTLHYYFRKSTPPFKYSIHSINHLQSDSIECTLSFRKISPC